MPRKHRQILPFRIPFFRIFYSTTYTAVFLVTLVFLAITPGSLLWEAIRNDALQYVFIIGGVYILTALIAIFIYSSRLYTNRSVLVSVGKAYLPIEDGEVGNKVRRLIVSQLERSAIISWEAKPRDVKGEIAFAEREGLLAAASTNDKGDISTIGTIVPVEIDDPPWGNVQHPGWTAPSDAVAELQNDLQFELVIRELPNLLEAQAVSLAPLINEMPDPRFVEILRRQEKMGMREYITQLSYLRLVDLNLDGRKLLSRYERARFSGAATSYADFKALMLVFGNVMDDMKQIDPAIAKEIQNQVHPDNYEPEVPRRRTPSPSQFASSLGSFTGSIDGTSPVTARTRVTTPYVVQGNVSADSLGSVLQAPTERMTTPHWQMEAEDASIHRSTDESEMGSVLHFAVE